MAKIQQLSPHLADLIAAGEVVERPASCAKELVENSIDAGATQITVELQNGGMTYLRITDNGCGIPAEDLETAFLRHATSKLRTAADLEAIGTLGFRGEALAAISAVSRMDVMTKTADADFGTSLHLEAGVVKERSDAGCPTGTTMIVRDLFYNTPARMKFMKSDSAEASALVSSMQKLALAHPQIAFRVIKDGQVQFQTTGDGSLYSAIYGVLGKLTAKDMIPVESHWEKYSLTGYVSKATATRGNRSLQIFFVNGRLVRSKSMTVALEEAYRNRMMVGRFPFCVLHLRMPEHLVDVNVHPAKVEVKFLNERDVFDTVRYGVEGALDKTTDRPRVKLPGEGRDEPSSEAPGIPGFGSSSAQGAGLAGTTGQPNSVPGYSNTPGRGSSGGKAKTSLPLSSSRGEFYRTMTAEEYRSFAKAVTKIPPVTPSKTVQEQLFSPRKEREKETPVAAEVPVAVETPGLPTAENPILLSQEETPYRMVGEVLNTYIIVEQGKTLLLIDKHAAHERILFERLRARQEPMMSQFLLTPLLFTPEREEGTVLLENVDILSHLGFGLSDYGDGTLAIGAIPAELPQEEAEATLNLLASQLLAGKQPELSTLRDELLHTIACKAAVKGGQHNGKAELEALVKEVLSREDLKCCPHGRPICITMTAAQLERQFKR
ncbi:MAG: DNA mismatch repair endonuclease MutL [Oscillospiraceae bacterium]|nr:DNA mismatch repair endonuclease MutL [Oscillospiraceae bacterium]